MEYWLLTLYSLLLTLDFILLSLDSWLLTHDSGGKLHLYRLLTLYLWVLPHYLFATWFQLIKKKYDLLGFLKYFHEYFCEEGKFWQTHHKTVVELECVLERRNQGLLEMSFKKNVLIFPRVCKSATKTAKTVLTLGLKP